MSITTSLRIAALEANRRCNDALKPTGLTFCQYTVLEAVAANPGISGAKAAKACAVTPQNAWTVIGNLLAVNAIEQNRIPGMGRAIPMYITGTGKNTLRKARMIIADVDAYYHAELGQGIADALDVFAGTVIHPTED